MFRGKNSTIVRPEYWKRPKKKNLKIAQTRHFIVIQNIISPSWNVKKRDKVAEGARYYFILLISTTLTNLDTYSRAHPV